MVLKHLHQPRFTDASFAAQEYNLTLPVFDLIPTFQEQPYFLLSPDQRCQSSDRSNFKTALRITFPKNSVHPRRFCYTFQGMKPQVFQRKVALNQAVCGIANRYGIWLSDTLYPGSHIRCFSQS
jgi:hypothetical protein